MLIGMGSGYRVDGRYELSERLGKGTHGEVWSAQEWVGGDVIGCVAIKLCEAEQVAARQRLVREAQAMSQLAHVHLVTYRGCGFLEDRVFYLVMELAETSLEGLLRREGLLDTEGARRCIGDAATALAHIHDRGAVHRDVKPANLLRIGGMWKLGDMGLARAVLGEQQTASGAWGTPLYMSPEQASGQIGAASDVYALGVTAQEALTGVLPYSGSTPLELAAKIIAAAPAIAPGLPAPWDALVPQMLSREPRDRPAAAEVAAALRDGVRTTPAARAPVGSSGASADDQFRRLAGLALADGTLSESERKRLVAAARDLGLDTERATRIAREERDRQRGASRATSGPYPSVVVRVEDLASHLGARGPRFEPGVTPSKLGWGTDSQAHRRRFVVNPRDLAEMVWVPAGRFRMGSTQEEVHRLWRENGWAEGWKEYTQDEQPAHEALISKGFWLYRHEVTNNQYSRFLQATGHAPHPWWSDYQAYGRLPVVNVTWDDCMAYSEWSGGMLPTEVQWEYGARGPEGLLFPWGNIWDRTRCVCAEYHAQRALNDYVSWEAWYLSAGAKVDGKGNWVLGSPSVVRLLRAVDSFPERDSWCGALDMSGNVWEWCADWYDGDAYKRHAKGNLTPPEYGSSRVLRGGSWFGSAIYCRSAYRGDDDPTNRSGFSGFRVASAL